ncbi:tRNA (adenosine(37)-N6)-threonylcarbamoyltransferase complex transferase subunit TsaD [Robiginitalea sp. M366]|uniref:tRNA (adenosine(37)-N6)-threonylcarbamoyltransferase complex transferase subunit TsaD n=1 Tax=Robiginitalea aestuariiviva TaxID=3036903 RepID=UPI00240E407F|nr:tRNA (adenosine(37)-N6)-threonylcarbamoyltransferase complex transferase subunit TsaD [Robiginitalea aestuariiviva]MDG1572696.1 tRNA (adenosine(37)-N6)-threonylcarbamoyltransferase complex transferase subunit TsaD [Robiginitalea aestuariiviva]
MSKAPVYILAIESSCDDTSAAVLRDRKALSNVVATQHIHEAYGGVVPELASRAHQLHIVPLVHQALAQANIDKKQLSAIAFTRGPGLLGSLLVGTSFAKSLALGLNIPLLAVNHMEAHVLAHFLEAPGMTAPPFPFLAMTISGGHTQILRVEDHFKMEVLGETLDDAVGEAFDKSAKLLGFPYPGGPMVDRMASQGDPRRFRFPIPKVPGLNFSFSGLKTSILYFLQQETEKDSDFVAKNLPDLCASIQHTIVTILMQKLRKASEQTGIRHIAIGGGVSANSGIRQALKAEESRLRWITYLPPFEYCTDNAAMIGIVGHLKYLEKDFSDLRVTAKARFRIGS